MAIAHVCMGCGLDLARHRALIDPHYHLPLVICSRCGRAEVRRRHPVPRTLRQLLRLQKPLLVIAVQIGVLTLLSLLTIFAAYAHYEFVDLRRWRLLQGGDWALLLLGLVYLPVMTGAWLSSTLAHWPRMTQWFAWGLFVLFIGWFAADFHHELESTVRGSAPPKPVDYKWEGALCIFVVMWLISFLGYPIGGLCRRAAQANSRQRWRKRRARLRRRRTGS